MSNTEETAWAEAFAEAYQTAAEATIAEAIKDSVPYDLGAFDPDAPFKASLAPTPTSKSTNNLTPNK
jgi:hypothetical protein